MIKLDKKPKNPTIIEGFPGFGLVATIATEFLIEHLKCEQIGRYWFEDLPATIAIHDGKVIDPVGIFYNKDYNIVVIHSISAITGIEWKASEIILDVAKQLNGKEIISIEGVGGVTGDEVEDETEGRVFYYCSDNKNKKKMDDIGLKPLKEGIIIGVTGALLLKCDRAITSVFAEAHTNMPDSKAAANVIEVLDKYLGLKVDYRPLLEQAAKFEEKLKGIMEKSVKAMSEQEKKQLSYVG